MASYADQRAWCFPTMPSFNIGHAQQGKGSMAVSLSGCDMLPPATLSMLPQLFPMAALGCPLFYPAFNPMVSGMPGAYFPTPANFMFASDVPAVLACGLPCESSSSNAANSAAAAQPHLQPPSLTAPEPADKARPYPCLAYRNDASSRTSLESSCGTTATASTKDVSREAPTPRSQPPDARAPSRGTGADAGWVKPAAQRAVCCSEVTLASGATAMDEAAWINAHGTDPGVFLQRQGHLPSGLSAEPCPVPAPTALATASEQRTRHPSEALVGASVLLPGLPAAWPLVAAASAAGGLCAGVPGPSGGSPECGVAAAGRAPSSCPVSAYAAAPSTCAGLPETLPALLCAVVGGMPVGTGRTSQGVPEATATGRGQAQPLSRSCSGGAGRRAPTGLACSLQTTDAGALPRQRKRQRHEPASGVGSAFPAAAGAGAGPGAPSGSPPWDVPDGAGHGSSADGRSPEHAGSGTGSRGWPGGLQLSTVRPAAGAMLVGGDGLHGACGGPAAGAAAVLPQVPAMHAPWAWLCSGVAGEHGINGAAPAAVAAAGGGVREGSVVIRSASLAALAAELQAVLAEETGVLASEEDDDEDGASGGTSIFHGGGVGYYGAGAEEGEGGGETGV